MKRAILLLVSAPLAAAFALPPLRSAEAPWRSPSRPAVLAVGAFRAPAQPTHVGTEVVGVAVLAGLGAALATRRPALRGALSQEPGDAFRRLPGRLGSPVAMAEGGPSSGSPSEAKRKTMAKARRAVATQGRGGMRPRQGAKHSEQKRPAAARGFGIAEKGLKYDRRPKPSAECGCGSALSYGECCGPVHEKGSTEDPVSLVRARFTAFKYRLPDFLIGTTDPESKEYEPDTGAWKRALLTYLDSFEFQTLEIGEVEDVAEDAPVARVAFRANFAEKAKLNLLTLCEQSTFRRGEDGAWLYVDGQVEYEAQSL